MANIYPAVFFTNSHADSNNSGKVNAKRYRNTRSSTRRRATIKRSSAAAVNRLNCSYKPASISFCARITASCAAYSSCRSFTLAFKDSNTLVRSISSASCSARWVAVRVRVRTQLSNVSQALSLIRCASPT